MSFPLTVAVSPASIRLSPGSAAEVEVTIVNIGDVVQHYEVSVVGLPTDDLWSRDVEATKLRPGETGTVRMQIALPDRGGITGGEYVLGVLVTSPYQADVSRSADLTLTVEAISGITMTAQPLLAYGHKQAAFTISAKNEGNVGVHVELSANDDQGRGRFTFQPPVLALPPGAAQSAMVEVSANGPFTGQERRSAITIRGMVGGESRGEANVTFIQPPRVPAGLFRTLGLVLAVLVVAGSIIGGALLGRNSPAAQTPGPSTAPSVVASSAAGENPPQVQSFGFAPEAPMAAEQVTVSAAVTGDPETWNWQLLSPEDQEVLSTAETEQSFTFTPNIGGTYTVIMAVAAATGDAITMTLAVPVADPPPNLETITTRVQIAPGQIGGEPAACPDGKVAVGGGIHSLVENPAVAGTELLISEPTGDADNPDEWTGLLRNTGGAVIDAAISVICAEPPSGHSDETEQATVPPQQSLTLNSQCGEGKVVLGGGGGLESDGFTDTAGVLEESRPVLGDDGDFSAWQVRVRNNSDFEQQLEIRAICADRPAGYSVTTEQEEINAGTTEWAHNAECPGGTDPLAGGVGIDESDESVPRSEDSRLVLRDSAASSIEPETPPDQWSAAVRISSNTPQILAVYAICGAL